MAKQNSPLGCLSILIGLGLIGVVGIGLGAIALKPTLKALEPMYNNAANTGSTDDYEIRYIASEAMNPTFQVNDRILIYRKAYEGDRPKRGDIILFNPTETLKAQKFNDPFIERVIGLPGETVEIKNSQVYINNQPIKEDYILEPPEYEFKSTKIPEKSYFVLGDHRNNSYDSHYWGYVPEELIIGKVTSIFWPPSRATEFD